MLRDFTTGPKIFLLGDFIKVHMSVWFRRQNCILADEMGLGKTIQSITLLSEIHAAGIQGPFLVIAPLSTITNWEREFSTWTNMNAIVYHGSLASRQMIQQYEMYCKDDKVVYFFYIIFDLLTYVVWL